MPLHGGDKSLKLASGAGSAGWVPHALLGLPLAARSEAPPGQVLQGCAEPNLGPTWGAALPRQHEATQRRPGTAGGCPPGVCCPKHL